MKTTKFPLGRRTLLGSGAALAAAATTSAAYAAPASQVFAHGVASGDPMPERVVIWTRVTPTKASRPGSGRGPFVAVDWQVSKDADFRTIVRKGAFTTGPFRDHTVKVDVTRLRPATGYYYRFSLGNIRSRVGRFRTAPAERSLPGNIRFGVVSCANYQAGFFSAYRALAQRNDLHAVLCLGDYLYEYGPGQYGNGGDDRDIRKHDPAHEMVSISDYRRRHAQYKLDPDLADLHARYPWIVTWDDHEVTNDAYKGGAENHQANEGDYHERRNRAHRAYDEWMPARLGGSAKVHDGTRLYRRLRFGRLAEISMLDLRTYRSKQVATLAPSPVPATTPAVGDPKRTILGRSQLRWLQKSFLRGPSQWKIIGNPVMIAPVSFAALPKAVLGPINDVTGLLPDDGFPLNVDQWDGYTYDRAQVLGFIRDHQVKNALFITGDIHSGWAAELPYDPESYPLSASAGVEFVCTSVTSNNLKDILGTPPRTASVAIEQVILANNRHIKYLNFDDHGFSVLDVTARRAQMDWYVIGDRADPRTQVRWSVSYATDSNTAKVHRVAGPVS